jgi:DNA-binding response OmpR family regulator
MLTSEIHLITADTALREAIREQLNSTGIISAPVREAASLPSPFPMEAAAIILDVPLLDKKALDVMRDLHAEGRKPKIFLLGEIENDEDLIAESFPKPLRLGHLLARVQFHLQATRNHAGPLLFSCFRLEPVLRQVVVEPAGTVIRLTEKETHLLEYLGRSEKPIAREELLAAIWGYDGRIDTHTLETHIYRLRRKLDPDSTQPEAIITSQGAYHLAARA